MAENKFTHGQGLGSSIGGAISDKFKSKVMGVKEKFTVLNMVRKVTGKGTFGKIATTLVGRALGKSERDISYFGGYGRKGKKYSKKNTNIPQLDDNDIIIDDNDGESNGKSVAILRDMYEFMQKNYEQEKVRYELDKSSKKELEDEENRKQKHLMDSLVNKKATPEKVDEEGPKTFVEKLLNGIKEMLSFVLSPLMLGLGALGKFAKLIGSLPMLLLDMFKMGSVISKIMMIIRPLFAAGSIFTFLKFFTKSVIGPYVLLITSAELIRKWSEGRENLKDSGQKIKKMTEVENGVTVNKKELSEEYSKSSEPQILREVPIPGTSSTLKIPMEKDDINLYAAAYKKYIVASDELKNYKMNLRFGTLGASDEEKQKIKNLENDVSVSKEDVYEQLIKYSGRLKPQSNLAKENENSITELLKLRESNINPESDNLINKAYGLKDDIGNKYDEYEKDYDDVKKFYESGKERIEELKKDSADLLDEFKKVPQFIDDLNNGKFNDTINENIDKVLSNNTVNNIGAGPSKTIDMASISSRNQDPTYKRGQIGSAQAV